MSKKTDVCIVGAGPAGSTAAKFLVEKGFKVNLIDKEKFPRDKPCGGGLPYQILKRYPYIDNENFVDSYSYGGYAYSSSLNHKILVKDKEPILAMTLRKKFDKNLVDLAVEKGADFVDGKAVVNLEITNDKAMVFLNDGTSISCDIVIGADGVFSKIAEKTDLRKRGEEIAICIYNEYEVDEKTIDEIAGKEHFVSILSRFQSIYGYGWVFPKNKHLNIGIGEVGYRLKNRPKKNLIDLYKDFFSTLKKLKIIPEKLEINKYHGGSLPIVPLKQTYCNRTILIGDAAGFINPFSGEGIYYAMVSGEIASTVIEKASKSENFDANLLSLYQKLWMKDFGKDIYSFYNLAKNQRNKPNENIFKVASKDDVLSDLFLKIMIGRLPLRQYKWKVFRRYTIGYLKQAFRS
ncbi:MAG: NAD(P)/FAD-dependent oxidoreductase [Candidatus Thermoplasmatota archaeon]|nr:NAD(P)/FAD-dependent oxidoreductase [Candidatus Thermoplasmatota archaeon]